MFVLGILWKIRLYAFSIFRWCRAMETRIEEACNRQKPIGRYSVGKNWKLFNKSEIHNHEIPLTFHSSCSQSWLSCCWSVYQYHCLHRHSPLVRYNVHWSANVPMASSSMPTSWALPTTRQRCPANTTDRIMLFTDMYFVRGVTTAYLHWTQTFGDCFYCFQ